MFTVGTDTEFFLQKNGSFVSAIPIIKGKKHCPEKLPNGGDLSHDNVALEFATPVAEDKNKLVELVRSSLKDSISRLPKGIKLNQDSSSNFPEEELNNEEARLFGCDPDYDAWELCINEVPADAPSRPFRSVGGHLHVGYVEESGYDFLLDPYGKVDFVKTLDAIVGVAITALDTSTGAADRRTLYGKAGCHRPKEYGVEYRTLSNFWLSSPKLVDLVYSLAAVSLEMTKSGKVKEIVDEITQEEIIRVINESDKDKALSIWNSTLKKHMSPSIVKLFNSCNKKKPFNIYQEWSL